MISPSLLGTQLSKASKDIDDALGSKDRKGARDSIVMQTRAMHIPIEALAIKLRKTFRHREKGAQLLEAAKTKTTQSSR
jgi:hypothetical protein